MATADIKCILFDVGGVIQLMKGDGMQHHQYIIEKLRMEKDAYFKAITPMIWDSTIGIITKDETLEHISLNLGIPKDELWELWKKAYESTLTLNKPLIDLIRKLRKKYKVGIFSDQWQISRHLMVDKAIEEDFDFFVFSNEVFTRKPYRKFYDLAVQKSGYNYNECLIVDDNKNNLKTAERLGINTLLFKNNDQLLKDLIRIGMNV